MQERTIPNHPLDRLATVPGVSELPLSTRQSIDRMSCEVHVRQGETVIRKGQIGSQAFIITEGRVEIRDDGRHIATRTAGDFVGEAVILWGGLRSADVVAQSDLTMLVMSTTELVTLYDDPAFRSWAEGRIATHAGA